MKFMSLPKDILLRDPYAARDTIENEVESEKSSFVRIYVESNAPYVHSKVSSYPKCAWDVGSKKSSFYYKSISL